MILYRLFVMTNALIFGFSASPAQYVASNPQAYLINQP